MNEQEEFHFIAGWYMVSNTKDGKIEKEIRDYLISHKRFSDENKCYISIHRNRAVSTPLGEIPINSRMLMCLN